MGLSHIRKKNLITETRHTYKAVYTFQDHVYYVTYRVGITRNFAWEFFGVNTFLVLEFYFGRHPEVWGPVIWNLEFSSWGVFIFVLSRNYINIKQTMLVYHWKLIAWDSCFPWILFVKILALLQCEVIVFQNAERIRWHTFLWICC